MVFSPWLLGSVTVQEVDCPEPRLIGLHATLVKVVPEGPVGWWPSWMCCANSVKDVPLARYLADAARSSRVRLYIVVTSSLPLGFLREAVLPVASAVIAGADELAPLAGRPVPRAIEAALDL